MNVPVRIAERPERERRRAPMTSLEPGDRLVDVGDGDADVIDADEAELPLPLPAPQARPGAR